MKIIALGGVKCWTETVTHAGGVATVRYTGVLIDRAVVEFWRASPVATVILFDYRQAIIAYRSTICLPTIAAQRAGPPAARPGNFFRKR